jgi:hypothetical protein
MPADPTPGPWWPAAAELAMASGAALLAGYVRARRNPEPLSFPSLCAKAAEAVVCGCLAVMIAALLEAVDPRVTVGISAALGLLGTGLLSDLATRWLSTRAGKP